MVDVILVAAGLWICPGDVYTNQPREGCKPVQESDKEGFSKIPEAPGFSGNAGSSSAPVDTQPAMGASPRGQQNRGPSASAEECALYDEWLKLSMKSNSIGAHDLSPQEFERWSNLRQIYAVSAPPVCSPQQ